MFKQQIIVKGNLKSLARNTNPFGRVFMTDLNNIIDPNDTEPTDEELVEIELTLDDIFLNDEYED